MRVEINQGENNILLVAPHGHRLDDTYTDIITREMAKHIKCHYVLNHGWKRDPVFNAALGLANCNDINHCKNQEVTDFLSPIEQYTKELSKKHGVVQVLFIHGMSDAICHRVPALDAILGYGEGESPRHICSLWRKNLLIDKMVEQGWRVREGAPGGKFSAYSKTNLAQAICDGKGIQGIQIEIVANRRSTESRSMATAKQLAQAVIESREYIRRNYKNPDRYKNYIRINQVGQI